MISAGVQSEVGAETVLWLIVCMQRRHLALFPSAANVWPCALFGQVLSTVTVDAGVLVS